MSVPPNNAADEARPDWSFAADLGVRPTETEQTRAGPELVI